MKIRYSTRTMLIATAMIAICAWLWTATNSRGINDVRLSHNEQLVSAIGKAENVPDSTLSRWRAYPNFASGGRFANVRCPIPLIVSFNSDLSVSTDDKRSLTRGGRQVYFWLFGYTAKLSG